MRKKLHLANPLFTRRLLLLIFALTGIWQVSAQDISVRGKVVSQEGESIPGANVTVKNTIIGTVTDLDGNYSIKVPNENQTLVFSFIGYITQEVPINGRSVIDIQLETDVQALDEVVIIGYGSVQKTDLTGSVGRVDVEDLIKAPVASFT